AWVTRTTPSRPASITRPSVAATRTSSTTSARGASPLAASPTRSRTGSSSTRAAAPRSRTRHSVRRCSPTSPRSEDRSREKIMSNFRLYLVLAPLMGAGLLGSATAGTGGGSLETDPHVGGPTVLVTDLAANTPILTDRNGIVHAPHFVDP